MNRITLTLFVLLAGSIGSANDLPRAGFDPAPFPELREIGEIRSEAGLFRIAMDAGMHRSFRTLRLAKKKGEAWQEMPMVSQRTPGPKEIGDFLTPHRIESLNETPGGGLEIVVSFNSPLQGPIRLEIDTPLSDFEKGVSIAVPGTDGAWQEVLSDGVIFDHRRFLDFRHTAIQVPAVNSRTLRLRIAEATDLQRSHLRDITRTVGDASGLTVTESSAVETRAFRIDGLRFVHLRDQSKIESRGVERHPLTITEAATLPEGKTELLFDGGNLPIQQIVLETNDRNFRRAVSVQVPGPGDSWQTIHQTHLHRYEVGDFRDEKLSIPLTETRAKRWRLLIENGANAPVTFSAISCEGPAYEILFLADPGDQPALFVGSNEIPLTNAPLDTAPIEAAIRRNVPAGTVVAAEASPNPTYRAEAAQARGPGFLDSQPALWSSIALAVAVLLAVLYQAMRKIEEKPDAGE
ncbi:MAG: DUF3999 family protein [Verrucomicrobiales bacterium]